MFHNVTYSREQRDRAKAEGKFLLTLDVDGKAVKKGRATYQVLLTPEQVREIEEFFLKKYLKRKKV